MRNLGIVVGLAIAAAVVVPAAAQTYQDGTWRDTERLTKVTGSMSHVVGPEAKVAHKPTSDNEGYATLSEAKPAQTSAHLQFRTLGKPSMNAWRRNGGKLIKPWLVNATYFGLA